MAKKRVTGADAQTKRKLAMKISMKKRRNTGGGHMPEHHIHVCDGWKKATWIANGALCVEAGAEGSIGFHATSQLDAVGNGQLGRTAFSGEIMITKRRDRHTSLSFCLVKIEGERIS